MKKLLTTILIILFISTGAWAAGTDWMKQSTEKTADAAITTSGGLFAGVLVVSAPTTHVTIDVYDNATAASGAKLIPTTIVYAADSRMSPYELIEGPGLIRFYEGIYVDITSTGPVKYMVYFSSD